MKASLRKHVSVVEVLLQHNAQVDAQNKVSGALEYVMLSTFCLRFAFSRFTVIPVWISLDL